LGENGFLLRSYLRQYRHAVFGIICIAGIYISVFSLYYGFRAEAVCYATGLCLCAVALAGAVHFAFYRKKHAYLKRLAGYPAKNLSLEMGKYGGFLKEDLSSLIESDYICLLVRVLDECRKAADNFQKERQDMVDYYTAWVHQIKTPIAAMRLQLQAEDTAEHRQLLTDLFRIEQYAEMVLAYLRLDSETNDFVLRQYRLDGIIRQAVHKYAHEFIRRRLKLVYEPVNAEVLTDEKWLLFILEQVLSNAVKYTVSGSVTIRFTKTGCLEIADTGIGIAPDDVPRIFEKGYTGYNGRADKKATGLGLYLCRRAARRLSHEIYVSSTVGLGTTVTIDLGRHPVDVRD